MKPQLFLFFTILTLIFTFHDVVNSSKPPKNQQQHAEPRLQLAVRRGQAVLANFSALYDRSYAAYPGYFEEAIPLVERYQTEVTNLEEAYTAWTANNTEPMENLLWHLPGMVFDPEEESVSLASSFVQTAVTRIAAQEKRIRQEMTRIGRLMENDAAAANFTNVFDLLNATSVSLIRPLQEAIVKLNYTTARRPSANLTDDHFVEAIFSVAALEEQLQTLVDWEIKAAKLWTALAKLAKKEMAGKLGNDSLLHEVDEEAILRVQRYRYLELVTGKAVHRANRTFRQVVGPKGEAGKRDFEKYLRKLGTTAARRVVYF